MTDIQLAKAARKAATEIAAHRLPGSALSARDDLRVSAFTNYAGILESGEEGPFADEARRCVPVMLAT